MTKCYFCKNLVYTNQNNKIHFCSKYCIDQYNNYTTNNKNNYTLSYKICNSCFNEINSNTSQFYCNDKVYCSESCRNKVLYTVLYS